MKECCENFERDITDYVNASEDSKNRGVLFQKFNDSDVELHSQISSMSHNDLLSYSFSIAKEPIREHMMTIGHERVKNLKPGDAIYSAEDHWKLYYTIRDKDFEAGREVLLNMINRTSS